MHRKLLQVIILDTVVGTNVNAAISELLPHAYPVVSYRSRVIIVTHAVVIYAIIVAM